MGALTSSVPHCLEAVQVTDMRFCWLKDAVFTVKVFAKLSSINGLENYLTFLINIVNMALKRDLSIETCYSIIYTKDRKNEREAMHLAGYDVS